MDERDRGRVIHLADAQARIPGPPGPHFAGVMERGTLRIFLSRPVPPNRQTPHTQDEVYVIVRGHGVLVHGGARARFGPGDLLFVAAGIEHWFEDFTADLAVWVIFYGPQGGEVPL